MSARRVLTGFAVVLLALVGWLVVAPQQLGGQVALVATSGDSMVPTYEPGDLVVVVRGSDYAVGDVVAYHSDRLDSVVLHRIVDLDGDRYVFQGDDNDWLDPERPAEGQLVGEARLRIPHAGRLLELPVPVRVAGVAGLTALLLGAGALTGRRDHARSRAAGPSRRPDGRPRARRRAHERPAQAAARRTSWLGWPGQVAGAAAVVALAATALAAVSFTRSTTAPGEVDYAHHATFDYAADAPAGVVYPDGQVTTGDPVFLRLTDTVDVRFTHSLVHESPSGTATTGRMRLELADGSGWSRELPFGDEVTADDGDDLVIDAQLDIPRLQTMFAEVRRATGVAGGSQSVTVTAETETTGTLAGAAFSDGSTSAMSFQLGEHRLLPRPTAPDEAGGDTDAGFDTTEEGALVVAGAERAQLELGPIALDVSVARIVAVVVLAVALAALGAAVVGARRRRNLDEVQRVRARYGHRLVEIDAVQPPPGHGIVDVADMAALVHLAEHHDGPVLHHSKGGRHTYLVAGQTAQYRHHIDLAGSGAPGRGAATTTTRSRPTAPGSRLAARGTTPPWRNHTEDALFQEPPASRAGQGRPGAARRPTPVRSSG